MSLNVPPAPRTPSARAKKLIYAYAGKQLALLLVGGIFLLVGVPLTAVFCRDLPGELMLTLGHEMGIGRVTRTELQQHVKINNRHPTLIAYDYEVGGKTYHSDSSILDPGELAAGDTVNVEYRPSAPEISRLEGGTYGSFPLFVGFVGLFPLIGLMLFGGAVRSNRREIRAFRDGTETQGQVTFVGEDTSVRINHRHPLKVAWSFEVQGAAYTGELSSLDHSKLHGFKQGDAVTVLYLPDDPKANTVWVD